VINTIKRSLIKCDSSNWFHCD